MTEDERMRILKRYIHNPASDDSDLYYNGIYGSCDDLSSKIQVACSVLSDWKKQRNESEKRTIEKRPFPDYVPKSKRNTCTTPNPVFKTHKKDLRITFKLPENSIYSIKKSNDITKTVPKKRSRTEAEEEEQDGARGKKLTKIELVQSPVEPTVEKNLNININNIPSCLKARLEENNAVLIIRKNLTATDVAENNQRLSIPESQIKSPNFLTKEELTSLSYTQKPVPNLRAKLIEPSGEECDIKLARWRMGTTMVFNIFGSWKNVVARNNLRENMPIEIYSFREGSDLYFAVIRV